MFCSCLLKFLFDDCSIVKELLQSSEDVGSRVQKMLVPEFRRCWFQSSEDVGSRVQKMFLPEFIRCLLKFLFDVCSRV